MERWDESGYLVTIATAVALLNLLHVKMNQQLDATMLLVGAESYVVM